MCQKKSSIIRKPQLPGVGTAGQEEATAINQPQRIASLENLTKRDSCLIHNITEADMATEGTLPPCIYLDKSTGAGILGSIAR
jgi:hypothetical protein